MTTTDHPPAVPDGDHTAKADGASTVVAIDTLRRRKRLGNLLATRSHLATMAAQQRSHGLDDARESFDLQLAVESTIREEFPREHEAELGRWIQHDVAAEHPSGVLTADCGICRSIATARGVNLLPPGAA